MSETAKTNGCEQYRALVAEYQDWNVNTMLEIMRAESGCRPQANNAGTNSNGTTDYGLLQINSVHGYDVNQLYNPAYNIQAAHNIWLSQGYRAWSTFNNGKYLTFK